MFLSTKEGSQNKDCIKVCPTNAIRLINGNTFSCITCGICYKNCPNQAIFRNSYGGYVVDRAKCNGCGMCAFNCPINNINIEDGVVYGICSRCGVCAEKFPEDRIDGFDLQKDNQITLIKSLQILDFVLNNLPSKKENPKKEVIRSYFGTNSEKCILCGRCSYYCPTHAIKVKIDWENGICTHCGVCSDVCPNGAMNKLPFVDKYLCTLCLNCLKHCPRDAISINDFKISINKINLKPTGSIISCLNCGLCADLCENKSLIRDENRLRYDPTCDIVNTNHNKLETYCPANTLYEKEFSDSIMALGGFCVSCGKCTQVCPEHAREYLTHSWDGSVTDDCLSCGICVEMCQENAITLKRGSISVDLDKCILCENCAIHCPVDAIPKTTTYKNQISDGFNFIEQELCMHCGLCYGICSYDAIEKIDDNYVVNDEKCTYCGACKNVCPAKAFLFERNFKDSKRCV